MTQCVSKLLFDKNWPPYDRLNNQIDLLCLKRVELCKCTRADSIFCRPPNSSNRNTPTANYKTQQDYFVIRMHRLKLQTSRHERSAVQVKVLTIAAHKEFTPAVINNSGEKPIRNLGCSQNKLYCYIRDTWKNIKVHHKRKGYERTEGFSWLSAIKRRPATNTAMNGRVPKQASNISTRWASISFYTKILTATRILFTKFQ
jgi:hypothetical protein